MTNEELKELSIQQNQIIIELREELKETKEQNAAFMKLLRKINFETEVELMETTV